MKAICTCRVSNHECPMHPSAVALAIRKALLWTAAAPEEGKRDG